jgi:tetratricopeptide (TPR) repeat protein
LRAQLKDRQLNRIIAGVLALAALVTLVMLVEKLWLAIEPGPEKPIERTVQPDQGNTLFEQGYTLLESNQPEKALALLLQASELDPSSQETLFALGRSHEALENYAEARAVYARIREMNPSNPLGYEAVSRSFFPEGKLDQALYWLREAQAVKPKDLDLAAWMVFLNDSLEDYEAAGEWSEWLDNRITSQAQAMAMQAAHHYLSGDFELAVQYSNLAIRLGLDRQWNSDSIFMRIKRDEALANGDPGKGIQVFRAQHPELFEDDPAITPDNIQQAVDLALLLKLSGREEETRRMLKTAIAAYDQPHFTTGSSRAWLTSAKAEALAILGDEQATLVELRRIVDQGWRVMWRWETELNSNFIGIRGSTEFQALVRRLESDIARQRARTQTMTDSGLISPPPVSLKENLEIQ